MTCTDNHPPRTPTRRPAAEPLAPDLRLAVIDHLAEKDLSMTSSKKRRLGVVGLGVSFSLALSGCAGFGNLANEPGVTTLTLASVNNPQMQDMSQLQTEFNKAHPDIKVNIIFLEEGDLRNAITKDVAT